MDSCPECEVCEPCPECPEVECPACEACPVCDECEDCELLKEHIELELDDVELLELDTSQSEYKWNLYYNGDEYDNLERVTLTFTPECEEGDDLVLSIEDDEFYDDEPLCNEENTVELDVGDLQLGRNTLVFESDSYYAMEDIIVLNEYFGGEEETKTILDFKFEEADENDEEVFRGLNDITIKNYVEYKIFFDKEETDRDFRLGFDAPERDSLVLIKLNGEEIFEGEVSRRNNRIDLPGDELVEGNNYIVVMALQE